MKHKFLFVAVLLSTLFTTSLWAQTPGYAIYGDVPSGYSDLRANINIPSGIESEGVVSISGTQHSSHICQNAGTSVEIKPSVAFDMTLTSDFAIHIKMKKAAGTSNDVQLSFCNNNWNSIRAGFLISTTSVPDDDFQEIIIPHSSRMTNGGGQYYCDGNLAGTHTWNVGGDLLRIAAANGEAVYISQIYIEAEYVAPLEPQEPKRYYFVRSGDLPVIAGIECVDLRATEYAAWSANPGSVAPNLSGDYAAFTLPNQWFAADFRPKAQCMADVRKADWYLRMKIKTDAASLAGQNLRINLSNGAANFFLTNDYGDGEWHDVTFALADAANTLRSFPVSVNDIAFQLHANSSLSGTYFYIEYAYLTNDPLSDEKPAIVDNVAPANFSVAEKLGATMHNATTLQLYAEDEDTPITYTISYKVKGSSDTPIETSVNGTQSTTVEKEITGLAPETTYTFSVIASDPNGNETSPQVIEITTTEFSEKRYYFFRGAPASVNMPSAIACVDLRNGIGSTVAPQNSMTLTEYKYYSHFAKSGNWWSFNQNLSSATDMSEITQAEWYLVVKFRTNFTDGSFNIRLLNTGECYQVSQSNLSFDADGSWNTLTLALADAKKTLNFSASQTGTVFQFHANNGEGSYLDIAYAYLTNSASSADDLADVTNPVISALSDGDKTTTSVVLNVTASDDSGEPMTYIVKESETVLSSTPASGASGEETAITVSGLDGVNHTLTVIAQDGAGNQASQNIVVTLPAANEPPYNLSVSTIPAAHSIEFTMYAEDDNSALVYAILDGDMNILVDDIAGTAGSNTVYVLKGLAPETDYTFYVRVTDNADASVTSGVINETTTVLVEHRFYLMRGDNSEPLPSSATLASTMVDCNIEYGNVARDARAEYLSVKTNANWMSVSFKPTATVANTIDDDWYIVVRMRSALSTSFDFNRFRLNLVNNGQNWYINNSDADKQFGHDYNDNNWIVMTKRIGDRRAGTGVPASYLAAGQIAAQLHVDNNLVAGEYLDIDYIYFTDDITAIDEGTMNGKKIMIKENADNASLLDANDGLTVEVDLTRSLTNACYNSFCLPFDMSAEQVETVFGAGTTIGKLDNAHMKDGDELYLGFEFVHAIEAGVPYIIQPANEVANPLIANVTINKEPNNTVIDGVIAFKGVISPELINEESAESHSILLLGANNTLSWPNTTANIKGVRAYFETTSSVAHVARRARFGFQNEQATTDIDDVQGDNVQSTKVIENGQLFIIRDGVKYNVFGQTVIK